MTVKRKSFNIVRDLRNKPTLARMILETTNSPIPGISKIFCVLNINGEMKISTILVLFDAIKI